ncbi:hypothetical protein BMS3Abin04_01334 [bacterium BMS3Abin04]|nr:hypothetical protein BMS3Abin04_01334 [bacterium BMS3Abin04]
MKNTILKIICAIALTCLIFVSDLFANTTDAKFDSLITSGINQIYNIKFPEAQKTFAVMREEYPHHPAGKFFDAMIIWWKIVLDKDNEEYDDLFIDKLDSVIDMCDSILNEDPNNIDAMFFKGGSLGFEGRLYALRKKWFDAALSGKDALPLVYRVYEVDPNNKDVQLGFGIYNYYAEAIPEKYPFIKPVMIFFPGGDKELGIKQLKDAAEHSKYAKVESRFFLMTLYYQFEEEYKIALNYAKGLVKDFPDNPIFEKYLGRTYVKLGNYYDASLVFSDIRNKCNMPLPGYSDKIKREADYYIGVELEIKKDLDSAVTVFQECINLSRKVDGDKESGFFINAVFYLGKIYNEMGKKELAVKKYKEVLELDDYKGSHERAGKELQKLSQK